MELDFYKTPAGCYVEMDYDGEPSNVLIIRKPYEELKTADVRKYDKEYEDDIDFIVGDLYEPYNISLFADDEQYRGKWYSKNRVISDNSWAMVGISDWENVIQVPMSKVNRYIIRALFTNWRF